MLGWFRTHAPEGADIGPDALAVALAGPNPPVVVDVRTHVEYAAGHIEGARLLPLADLGRRVGELPKDRAVVCVCRSGHRSGVAARQLRGLGFTAQNMAGGMSRWRGPVATAARARRP